MQNKLNEIFRMLGLYNAISGKNEAAKKAEKSLKEEAESKLSQKGNFDEYKKKIYKENEEE